VGLGKHGRRRWRQRRWQTAAGGGGLAELGRKRPFGLGFDHGLDRKDAGATGITSRGSVWRDGGRRGTHGGGTLRGDSGEESRAREDGKERGKGPAMLLTGTRSSADNCSMVESSKAAARRAAEVQRR
jgi:hypothetical protein